MPFIEAFRQFQFRVDRDNFCCVLVSLILQVLIDQYIYSRESHLEFLGPRPGDSLLQVQLNISLGVICLAMELVVEYIFSHWDLFL